MPTRKWKMPGLFRSCPAWVEGILAARQRMVSWMRTGSLVILIGLMAGCGATRPAPVTERLPPAAKSPTKPKPAPATVRAAPADQPRPEFYTVRSGDTLYSIALEFGLDYRELATWNGIDPARIRVGQQLRLAPPQGVVATPLQAPGGAVEAQPLGSGSGGVAGGARIEPRGVRVPYSDQAYAQMAGVKPAPAVKAEVFPDANKPKLPADSDDIEWIWPVTGKIVTPFNDGSSKGIGIGGKMGQPVVAAGAGRVIFSGTGIRGLGKLIVIKHNEKFLSVYAHNRELLVKEGQAVTRGQKIAEMGNTDADQVKLHFEIRRLGKPVDPAALLPPA